MSPPLASALALVAGGVYLVNMLAGGFAMAARPSFIVRGDAAATAANILDAESLYRVIGAAELVAFACEVALAALLYRLLAPAAGSLALLAAGFRLTYGIISGVNTVNHFAPLRLLGADAALAAFTPDQLRALALTFTRLHSTGHNVAMVFFGVHLLLLGWLLVRAFASGYAARLVGALLALGGLGYLVNTFSGFLAPPVQATLFPAIVAPAALGHLSLCLWLIAVGLSARRSNARVSLARAPVP